jgi:hypothetical protein
LHLTPQLIEIALGGFTVAVECVLRSAQAEIHLENRLERAPVRLVLDERRRQGVLERFTIFDRNMPHGLHRIEVLREADRQACLTQLPNEPAEQVEHAALFGGAHSSTESSFAALAISVWYFNKM